MKLLAASVLILAVSVPAVPQEVKHAPALQACTADLNLWTAQIPDWPKANAKQEREGTKALTMLEMGDRMSYIGDCISAHPILNRANAGDIPLALSLIMTYDREVTQRYFDFLSRHDLLTKFSEEDRAGLR